MVLIVKEAVTVGSKAPAMDDSKRTLMSENAALALQRHC